VDIEVIVNEFLRLYFNNKKEYRNLEIEYMRRANEPLSGNIRSIEHEIGEIGESGQFALMRALGRQYSEKSLKSTSRSYAPFSFCGSQEYWFRRIGDLAVPSVERMLGAQLDSLYIHEPHRLWSMLESAPKDSLLKRMIFLGGYKEQKYHPILSDSRIQYLRSTGDYHPELEALDRANDMPVDKESGYLAVFSQVAGTEDSEVIHFNPDTKRISRVSNSYTKFMWRGLECIKRNIQQDWFHPSQEVLKIIQFIDGDNVLPTMEYGHTVFDLDRPEEWPENWRAMLNEKPPKTPKTKRKPVISAPPAYNPPMQISVDQTIAELWRIAEDTTSPHQSDVGSLFRPFIDTRKIDSELKRLQPLTLPSALERLLREIGGLAGSDAMQHFGEDWNDDLGLFPRREKVIIELINDGILPKFVRRFICLGHLSKIGFIGTWAASEGTKEGEVLLLNLEERTITRVSNSLGNFLYRGLECLKLSLPQNYYFPEPEVARLIAAVDGNNILPNDDLGHSQFSIDNTDVWPAAWKTVFAKMPKPSPDS
jgi:hypothetical protein